MFRRKKKVTPIIPPPKQYTVMSFADWYGRGGSPDEKWRLFKKHYADFQDQAKITNQVETKAMEKQEMEIQAKEKQAMEIQETEIQETEIQETEIELKDWLSVQKVRHPHYTSLNKCYVLTCIDEPNSLYGYIQFDEFTKKRPDPTQPRNEMPEKFLYISQIYTKVDGERGRGKYLFNWLFKEYGTKIPFVLEVEQASSPKLRAVYIKSYDFVGILDMVGNIMSEFILRCLKSANIDNPTGFSDDHKIPTIDGVINDKSYTVDRRDELIQHHAYRWLVRLPRALIQENENLELPRQAFSSHVKVEDSSPTNNKRSRQNTWIPQADQPVWEDQADGGPNTRSRQFNPSSQHGSGLFAAAQQPHQQQQQQQRPSITGNFLSGNHLQIGNPLNEQHHYQGYQGAQGSQGEEFQFEPAINRNRSHHSQDSQGSHFEPPKTRSHHSQDSQGSHFEPHINRSHHSQSSQGAEFHFEPPMTRSHHSQSSQGAEVHFELPINRNRSHHSQDSQGSQPSFSGVSEVSTTRSPEEHHHHNYFITQPSITTHHHHSYTPNMSHRTRSQM